MSDAALSGRVGRGLGWSTFGNMTLRIGNFLVSILIARLIAPEQFGVFAVALTVWNILGTLAEFGLGTDLVRARDPGRRAPTIATLGVLISGTFALSMALGAPAIAAAFESPESTDVIRLMAVSLGVFGFTIVPAALLQREYRQRAVFLVNMSGMAASTGTIVVLALAEVGPAALAWGQIANQTVLVLLLHAATRRWPTFGFRGDVARESVAFCLPLATANLVSWLLITLDNLIVARGLSTTALGLYVLAFNVSSWPMNAVGQAIRVVALPAFSGIEDRAARNAGLVRTSAPVLTVAAFMALVLASLAEPAIRVLYGDRWSAAATALAGLAVFGGLRVVMDLVATFLIAAGATRGVLLVQLVWLAAMLPCMVWAVGRYGLAGAGWTHAAVAAVVVLPAYGVCLHRLGVDVGAFLRGWVRPLAVSVPAAVGCGWVGSQQSSPWAGLLSGCVVAGVLYALPLGRWWVDQVRQLRQAVDSPGTAVPADEAALT